MLRQKDVNISISSNLAAPICAVSIWIPCQGNVKVLACVLWGDLKLDCSFRIEWLGCIEVWVLLLAGLHVLLGLKSDPAMQLSFTCDDGHATLAPMLAGKHNAG